MLVIMRRAAAALGRGRVDHSVAFARRVVARSCACWYPVVRELHRFFIAIARTVLNYDGASGTSLHLVECCQPEEEEDSSWWWKFC